MKTIAPSFDDHLLAEKMQAEVRWTFTDVELELIEILDLQWQRVTPGKDALAHELRFHDEQNPGVMFTSTCLVRSEAELLVMRDAFLYTEAGLAEAGNGPVACPDCFNDLSVETVDFTAPLLSKVRAALLTMARDSASNLLGKLLDAHADAEGFVSSIADAAVRDAFRKYREQPHSSAN